MADLGSIGRVLRKTTLLHSGAISGTVQDEGSNYTRHCVRAFHRESGALSGGAFSDPNSGAYTIHTGISFGKEKHTVVDYDDPSGDQHNARVIDHVTPL